MKEEIWNSCSYSGKLIKAIVLILIVWFWHWSNEWNLEKLIFYFSRKKFQGLLYFLRDSEKLRDKLWFIVFPTNILPLLRLIFFDSHQYTHLFLWCFSVLNKRLYHNLKKKIHKLKVLLSYFKMWVSLWIYRSPLRNGD